MPPSCHTGLSDRGQYGKLVLGLAHSTISHPIVTASVQVCLEQSRDMQLNFIIAGTLEIYSTIAAIQIDLGFARPLKTANLRFQENNVVWDAIVLATPKARAIKANWRPRPLNVSEVLRFELILYRDSTDPVLLNATVVGVENHALSLNDVQFCPNVNFVLELISANLGVAIMPWSFSAQINQSSIMRSYASSISLI